MFGSSGLRYARLLLNLGLAMMPWEVSTTPAQAPGWSAEPGRKHDSRLCLGLVFNAWFPTFALSMSLYIFMYIYMYMHVRMYLYWFSIHIRSTVTYTYTHVCVLRAVDIYTLRSLASPGKTCGEVLNFCCWKDHRLAVSIL